MRHLGRLKTLAAQDQRRARVARYHLRYAQVVATPSLSRGPGVPARVVRHIDYPEGVVRAWQD